MTYDAAKNSADSYREAIAAKRAKLLMERIPTAKRVEVIGDCELILGDCLEVMPHLEKVDAVVTDPPWNMDYFENDSKEWPEYADWLSQLNRLYDKVGATSIIVFLSSKAIQHVSHVYIGWQAFAAVKNFSQMSKSKDIIPNAFDIGFAKIQGTYTGKGRNWFLCNTAGMIGDRTGHPTPRTVDAMTQCMEWIDAHTILDAFMGSGTTGVACVKLGRRFIGIELDEGYFNIACERIRKAYAQPDLFIETAKAPEPKQEPLL